MFNRLGAIAFAARAKTERDILEDPELIKICATKANFYKFRTLPTSMWIYGVICIIFGGFANFFLVKVRHTGDEYLSFIYIMMFCLYGLGFLCLYAGKIEILVIDKKKGMIKRSEINIFLSKIERFCYIDRVEDVLMVLKGFKSYAADTTRYFIRFTLKDGETLEFGRTFSYYEIQFKYRVCRALIKGEINLKQAKKYLVVDEVINESKED